MSYSYLSAWSFHCQGSSASFGAIVVDVTWGARPRGSNKNFELNRSDVRIHWNLRLPKSTSNAQHKEEKNCDRLDWFHFAIDSTFQLGEKTT